MNDAPGTATWGRRLLQAMALAVGGVLVALLAAELSLRLVPDLFPGRIAALAQVARQRMALDGAIASDPMLGLKLKPGVDIPIEHPDYRYRIRTYLNYAGIGFRGNVAERPVVGVAVGDSFTFGVGVEAEEAWPEQLSQRLGRNIVNLGVVGYGSPQYTIVLERYGVQLASKLILYAVYENDLQDSACFERWRQEGGPYTCAGPRQTPSSQWQWFLARHFILYHFATQLNQPESLRIRYRDRTDLTLVLKPPAFSIARTIESHKGWVPTQRAILQAKAIADRQGATFILLLLPSKEQGYWSLLKERLRDPSRYDIDAVNRAVLRFCQTSGLRCLDLTPTFREAIAASAHPYFRIDAHFTPEGHRLAASTIHDYLVKHRLLEGAEKR